MHGYINRTTGAAVRRRLAANPVVALLGPRQSGKSTLAKHLLEDRDATVYLDLERPSDLRKLSDPETWFEHHRGELICLDEIQRQPGLFEVLRSVVDEVGASGQFLVLGSASPELLRQSSETLAGRIAFVELGPFSREEVPDEKRLWVRGGYPRSYLAPDDAESFEWRLDFVRTFLERDVPQLGSRAPAPTLHRLWQMVAHSQGQVLNSSKLGAALGMSHTTVRSYLDLFVAAFLVRWLPPFEGNVKKRLVRSPKVYVRDSGILHALLELDDFDSLAGHPVYGPSWEGLVLETVLGALGPGWSASFYRTSHGAEIDLVLTRGLRRIAVECKASSAPSVARGFWRAREDIGAEQAFVVAPVRERYPMRDIWVVPLGEIARLAREGFPRSE